ncbi:ceramidase [Papiliotrema laurentii]|uniref:Ceramidase n=1 Tax=Papiliotrema laurentii TaxID=5418 RepID=A0AAD9CWH9_PAPLA|nr:ceramidase [Papiliotrema laurentii]
MGAFDGLRVGQVDHGFWGNHTSSIDWCETNYAVLPYVAEFVNTLSNLPSILLGLYGAIATVQGGVRSRYALCYLGLSFIGIGSTGFHASLKWEWQLLDELPMIYVVSYAAYLVLDTLPSFKPRFGIWGPLVLVSWDVFVTLSYLYLPNPIYHQVAFAAILLTSVARNFVLLRRLPAAHPARKAITKTIALGIVVFAAAFGIWNVDNICCDRLRSARELLGPWGFLLEGESRGVYSTLTPLSTPLLWVWR